MLTYNNPIVTSIGARFRSVALINLDNSYPTGGYLIDPAQLGLVNIEQLNATANGDGFLFDFDTTTGKLKVYDVAGGGLTGTIAPASAGTPAGTNGTSAVTGTAAAQAFTGTSPLTNLDLATPAFSGTGLTAAGQVFTTTDNQTMTLNQCAGMWLLYNTPNSSSPALILSNTAVSGAPAVLTIQGNCTTDAGPYSIVKHAAPVGTNAPSASLTATADAQIFTGAALGTHTHTATLSGAAALAEVPNATDLTVVASLQIVAIGQ